MQIKQLEYFLEAAKYQSISKAAEKIFVSHQALSSAIRSLENELGFVLFERTLQGISLTPKGARILEDAEEILDIYYNWKRIQEDELQSIKGDVLIMAPPAICHNIIADIISDCAQHYPLLNIILYEGKDLELFNAISSGKVSIIVDGYSGEEEKTVAYTISKKHKLILENVFSDSYHIYLNTNNPLGQKEFLTKNDLKTLQLAVYPNKEYHCAYSFIYDYFDQNKIYYIAHQESIFHLIQTVESIASIYPKIISRKNHYCATGLIKAVPIGEEDLGLTNFILHQPFNRCTLAERMIIDKIKREFASIAQQIYST